MGGCRCTYRNCSVRTDGATHMFHYPVFDKVRCHQWLTNAQKHEFLDLKVSQLKNRVVCQHHFKDEDFMNFKKDKLTFQAVPTLDGPYCDPGRYANETVSQYETKIYPISLDDIENEYLTLSDKKANFSVKYGDFLTNCEVMDMDTINFVSNSKTRVFNKDKNKNLEEPHIKKFNKLQDSTTLNVLPNNPSIVTDDTQTQIEDLAPAGYMLVPPAILDVEYDTLNSNLNKECDKLSNNKNNKVTQAIQQDNNVNYQNTIDVPQVKKVKILSEKTLHEPVRLVGKLEPVSPTQILPMIDRKNRTINLNNGTKTKVKDENTSHINVIGNNTDKLSKKEVASDLNQKQLNKNVLKKTVNKRIFSNKSLLKPKLNQVRVAAIKEKRKFNMKLRDIIESCLDKMDAQESGLIENNTNLKNEQVSTFLSKDTALPSIEEYTIGNLAARMKRMEDVLLNKIDQNTQRILELKNSILTSAKKSSFTQTTHNEDLHKKQLFEEISKYLSADANSLIYEELFINKYGQSTSQDIISSPKRRRRK